MKKQIYLENSLEPKRLFQESNGCFYGLNFCACHGLWPGFPKQNFKKNQFFYDDSVVTYRNEKGKVFGLNRLECFNRFQAIMLTKKEDFKEVFENFYNRLISFFKILKIPFEVIKKENWANNPENLDAYTYDFETTLDNKKLQVGNLSNNGTYWTNRYDIRISNFRAVSGCSGVGIPRLINCFLAMHSFNKGDWPI